ncbi:MAG: ribosome assembly cofactor RimP [Mariprofundaceae bacterium]
MREQIGALLTPIAKDLGVDVLAIHVGGGHHSQLLKVVIDQAGGVACENLERISRALSLQLDAANVIKGAYHIEVSTPGFDWPLSSHADFSRHIGEWVRVQLLDGNSLKGENLGPTADGFRLRPEHEDEREICMEEVLKVVRYVNWGSVSR